MHVASGETLKMACWTPRAPAEESGDVQFHRRLIVQIVFGLWYRKKELLNEKGLPAQPVSLSEI